jgi:hypothetical protein
MSYTIISQPPVDETITLVSRQAFDISFGSTYIYFDSSIQFIDSTPSLLLATSSNTFASAVGFTGSGNAGNLIVDSISLAPAVVQTIVKRIDGNTSMTGGAVDSNTGLVYFLDTNNHKLYVSDSNGNYSLFAGTGAAGYTNGPRQSAQFNNPLGVAVGNDSSVYVSDLYTIRKIDPTGIVTTLAGSNVSGAVDGTGSAARFSYPANICVDSNDDVYVSDAANHAIRKVTQAGVVTTYAGTLGISGYKDGTIVPISLLRAILMGVTSSSDASLRFVTSSNGTSWTPKSGDPFPGGQMNNFMVSPTNVIAVGSNSTDAIAITTDLSNWTGLGAAMFGSSSWNGIAINYDKNSNVWVAGGQGDSYCMAVSTDGSTWTSVSSPFDTVYDIAERVNGIWVAVGCNASSPCPAAVSPTNGASWFSLPGLSVDIGKSIAHDGVNTWAIAGTAGDGTEHVQIGVGLTGWTDTNLTVDVSAESVRKIAYGQGAFAVNYRAVGGAGKVAYTTDGITWNSTDVSDVSLSDQLAYIPDTTQWLAPTTNQKMWVSSDVSGWIQSNATGLSDITDYGTIQYYTDITNPRFALPRQITLDSGGVFYIADDDNGRIRTISNQTVSTLESNITRPMTICVDSSGTIFYGKNDQTIFKISNGTTTYVTGKSNVRGQVNGALSNATFYDIGSLSSFASNIYIPEIYNGTLRVLNFGVPDARPSGTRPAGYTIVASSNYNVQVVSRITANTTAVGGVIQLYAYESFSNSFTANIPTDTLRFTSSSSELIPFLSNVSPTEITFSSTSGFTRGIANPLTLLIEDLCGSTVMETYTASVRVGAGRFFPPAAGSVYSFFLNEPIVAQPFVASIPVQAPITSPALPIGLSLVRTGSNSFDLSGIPTVQLVASNYKVIGRGSLDPTKIVTVDVNIRVGAERLLIDVSGATSFPLAVDSNIQPSVITSKAPPYPLTGNNIRYTWSPLIEGLTFTDVSGIVRSSGFTPSDTSSTLILTGAPTENAARTTPPGTFTTTLLATRLSAPNITSNVSFAFSFGEQVLFSTTNIQSTFYVGAPVSSSSTSNSFSAFTKFATVDSSIAAIWSPDLRADLCLNFVYADQRAYITGTPTSSSVGTFTVYASNANGAVGSLQPFSYSVVNDTITFQSPTPAIDTCLNFIVSRSTSNAKDGYYTYPIQFKAAAASGCNIVLSTTGFNGTGLSLSNIGNSTYQIIGTPTVAQSLSTLTVDASSTVTTAVGSTSVQFAIVPEVFSFNDASFTFVQNIQITPYQFIVSTLSERNITGFTASNLPVGLLLSTTGRLTGAPLTSIDSSFTVFASTGYTTGSKNYVYETVDDAILLTTNPTVYAYSPGANVDIRISGVTYSGKTVSNYAFSNFTPSYGLSIGSTSGIISGNLYDNVPPNLLPASCNFSITAQAGLLDGSLNATLTTINPIVARRYVMYSALDFASGNIEVFYSDDGGNAWSNGLPGALKLTTSSISFQRKNNTLDSNVLMFSQSNQVGAPEEIVVRSTDGITFTDVSYAPSVQQYTSFTSSLANKTGTSTWWLIGNRILYPDLTRVGTLFITHDDGLTWTPSDPIVVGGINFYARDDNENELGGASPYVRGGAAIAYKGGVVMIGGKYTIDNELAVTGRSSNDGATWDSVANAFQKEVAYFSLDHPTTWIQTGSDTYTTLGASTPQTTSAQTIKYSVDQGLTWSNATGGFDRFGYEVVYGSNAWLATGVQSTGTDFRPQLRYSTDGSNWSVADLSDNPLFVESAVAQSPPMQLGPIGFDGSNWSVFVVRPNDVGNLALGYRSELYTHDISSSLQSNWSVKNITSSFAADSNTYFVNFLPPTYVRTAASTTAIFSFDSPPTSAIQFTSPTQTSFIFYQYMPIIPIFVNAVGTGQVYYYVETNDLPLGLTFDPITQVFSGTPMRTGENVITIYAEDDIGFSKLVLYTNTIIPNIVKNQTSAGAYTSLIRQYTEVNAAQNARDSRVLPTENKNLGEFQSPYKSDVVSANNRFNC